MRGRWARRLESAWQRRAPWLVLLRPVEWMFRAIVAARRAAYRHGVLRSWRAPVPVVVVGNITLGGTGKTPTVIALVEALAAQGLRAGVVSRGYGATRRNFPHVVSDSSTVDDCGDEALVLRRRTGCPCVVGPSRPAAVRRLLATAAVDVVLCDDGLQHYALQRDLEILLYDARRAFGNGWCLPAGPLREPLSRLREADFVLVKGGPDPGSAVTYRYGPLVNIVTGERLPPDSLHAGVGESLLAVAGLADPEPFFAALREAGYRIRERRFRDHARYDAATFVGLENEPIIMTEKDAVKCSRLLNDHAWYLQVSAELPESVVAAVVELARRGA